MKRLLFVAIVACGGAPPVTTPSVAPPMVATVAPITRPMPNPVALGEDVVCTLDDASAAARDVWIAERHASGVGSNAKIRVVGTAKASFAANGQALIDVDGAGFSVRGFYNRGWGDVHLKKNLVLSGLVQPTSESTMLLDHFTNGEALVRFGTSRLRKQTWEALSLKEESLPIPDAHVDCASLALSAAPHAPISEAMGAPALRDGSIRVFDSEVAKDSDIWFIQSSRGTLASLSSPPPPPPKDRFNGAAVEVVERNKRRVHVHFFASQERVDGWIAPTDVGPRDGRTSSNEHESKKSEDAAKPARFVRCANEIPLLATKGDERVRIGTIHASTRFGIDDERDGERRVTIDGITVEPVAWTMTSAMTDVRVRASDVASCADQASF